MAFQVKWTTEADRQFKAILANAEGAPAGSKQAGLAKQVRKTLSLLKQNPKHPGLHAHPYESLQHPYMAGKHVWEAYVQNKTPGAYRVFWCYGPDKGWLTVIAITPHP